MRPLDLTRPHTLAALAFDCALFLGLIGAAQAAPNLAMRTSLPTPASAASGSALKRLVAEAMQRSPLLSAARAQWLAKTRVPIQAATLPDPEFLVQNLAVGNPIPGNRLQTSNFAYFGYGVSEDIPYPGKLALRAAIATQSAKAARAQLAVERRRVAEQVEETYFNLAYLARTLTLLRQTYGEFERVEQITESQYEVGSAQQHDVLRAQLEMTDILRKIDAARAEFEQGQADLKAILGREPDSPDIAIDGISLTTLHLSSKALQKNALAGSPQLWKARAREARSSASLTLARENYIPNLSISYVYQKTGARFPDYYMATVGVKVPLFFWRKQTPAVEQAALEQDAARAQTHVARLAVLAGVHNQWIAANSTRQIAQVYADGLIPQAQLALASAMAAYRVGKVDFQTLLRAEIGLLNLREQYYRTVADHNIAVARIRQIIGGRL